MGVRKNLNPALARGAFCLQKQIPPAGAESPAGAEFRFSNAGLNEGKSGTAIGSCL
jgi:hypothetical protein